MKRIISLFALLVALTSCTVSEGWNSDQDYVAKKACDIVNKEIYGQIHFLSYAQTIDLYSRVGDGEREIIEDQHLANVRLRQTEKGWNVVGEGGRVMLSFVCDAPLDTLGSVWSVAISAGNSLTADQYWTIECTGEKRWTLCQHINYESHAVDLTLDVEAGDLLGGQLTGGPIYKYTIEGECSIVQNEMVVAPYRIDMKIIDRVVFDNFKYYTNYTGTAFTEGKMSIRVRDYKTDEWVVTPFHYTIAPEYSNQRIEYLMIN